jgi:hypothetical protein
MQRWFGLCNDELDGPDLTGMTIPQGSTAGMGLRVRPWVAVLLVPAHATLLELCCTPWVLCLNSTGF